MTFPPVVYAGPSISHAEVHALLPQATIQGPIGRGDLYRDRMLLYSFFVVLDGVFFQSSAISPRECVEVCRDGATVIGASSMGALRAAECGPAGMLGAGVVYRLFRAGCLTSDDEVAVTFDPDRPERALSLPLVNVRYATRRALRDGILDRDEALRVTASAGELFYADRRWLTILSNAGLAGRRRELEAYLSAHDLKRLDAVCALRKAAAMLSREPELGRTPHKLRMPFDLTESTRESEHVALSDEERARTEMTHWAFATGLYRSLLSRPRRANEGRSEPRPRPKRGVEAWEAKLWRALTKSDHGAYRWRAHRLALGRCRERGLTPSASDVALAERELAVAHGADSWDRLVSRYRNASEAWTLILAVRDELAAVAALRRVESALEPASNSGLLRLSPKNPGSS